MFLSRADRIHPRTQIHAPDGFGADFPKLQTEPISPPQCRGWLWEATTSQVSGFCTTYRRGLPRIHTQVSRIPQVLSSANRVHKPPDEPAAGTPVGSGILLSASKRPTNPIPAREARIQQIRKDEVSEWLTTGGSRHYRSRIRQSAVYLRSRNK
jgi:hypothetical protein